MAKRQQRNEAEGRPAPEEVPRVADGYLASLSDYKTRILEIESRAAAEWHEIVMRYDKEMEPLRILMEATVLALMQTMKFNKAVLFDGTDVVTLAHGTLIHTFADKVTIPRNALDTCRTLGFSDVIKTVESLDREAVEKWPDSRLTLIGAVRKPKEEFSYDLKKEEKPCQPA